MSDDHDLTGFLRGFVANILPEHGIFPKLECTPEGKTDYSLTCSPTFIREWTRGHLAHAVGCLKDHGQEATPEAVTVFLLQAMMKPRYFADPERRKIWFTYLLPLVEGELSKRQDSA